MAASRVHLDVLIDPAGVTLALPELRALLPGLQIEVSPAIERAPLRFTGRIEASGDEAELARAVARHLGTLRELSRQFPEVSIIVSEPPDGGELRLQGGSFGADEQELAGYLASIAGEQPWRLYLSFRIERDAHRHLSELLERALPAGAAPPVYEASDTALAVGFDIAGNAERVADCLAAARFAWRQEGSEAECLVEVEGAHPIVEVVRTWSHWVELERRLRRRADAGASSSESVAAPHAEMVELANMAGTDALGDRCLSWIDDDDRIFAIWRGALYSLPERVEHVNPPYGELRRTASGALHFVRGDRRVAIPPAPVGSERRFHAIVREGVVLSDSAGSANASTRLVLAGAHGVEEGLQLSHVRALAACDGSVYSLADGRSGLALLHIELGHGWGYTEARPWHQDEVATDVAVVSNGRIAITAQRDSRSTLYLVERANLVFARRITLPCVEPQVLAHSAEAIWLTGSSPAPDPARCDLFRVDVQSGMVTLVTAELDAKAVEATPPGYKVAWTPQLLLATERSVYVVERDAIRELVELAAGETVTGLVVGPPAVLFVASPRGSSIVIGAREATIDLEASGHEPRLDDHPPL